MSAGVASGRTHQQQPFTWRKIGLGGLHGRHAPLQSAFYGITAKEARLIGAALQNDALREPDRAAGRRAGVPRGC